MAESLIISSDVSISSSQFRYSLLSLSSQENVRSITQRLCRGLNWSCYWYSYIKLLLVEEGNQMEEIKTNQIYR